MTPRNRLRVVAGLGLGITLGVGGVVLRDAQVNRPEYLLGRAQAAIQRGDLDEGRVFLTKLLASEPDNALAHRDLARVLIQQAGKRSLDDEPEALGHAIRAAVMLPEDDELQSQILVALVNIGRITEAGPFANRILDKHPHHRDALYVRGAAALARRDLDAIRDTVAELRREETPLAARTLVLLMEATAAESWDADIRPIASLPAAGLRSWLTAALPRQRLDLLRLLPRYVQAGVGVEPVQSRVGDSLALIESLIDVDPAVRTSAAETAAIVVQPLLTLSKAGELPGDSAVRQALWSRFEILARTLADQGVASLNLYRLIALAAFERGDVDTGLARIDNALRAAKVATNEERQQWLTLHLLAARTRFLEGRVQELPPHLESLSQSGTPSFVGWATLFRSFQAIEGGRWDEVRSLAIQAASALGYTAPVRAVWARATLATQKWDQALIHLNALPTDPTTLDRESQVWVGKLLGDTPMLARHRALVLAMLNRFDDSEQVLATLKGTAQEAWAAGFKADLDLKRKPLAQAAASIEKDREARPDDLALAMKEWSTLERVGRAQEAAKQMEAFAKGHPTNLAAQLVWISAMVRSGRTDEALREIGTLRKRFPDRMEIDLTEADTLLVAGRVVEARMMAEHLANDSKVQKAQPTLAYLASLLAAKAALVQNKMPEAAALLEQAALKSKAPGSGDLLKAAQALILNDPRAASDSYAHALPVTLTRDASRLGLWQSLLALAHAKGPADAESQVDALLTRTPNEPVLIMLKADLALKQGKFDVGLEQFTRFRSTLAGMDPSMRHQAHRTLGDLAFVQTRRDLARKSRWLRLAMDHWTSALEIQPTDLVAANNVAFVQATESNQLAEAFATVALARAEVPVDRWPVEFVDTVALVLRKMGRSEEARLLLEQRRRAKGDEPLVLMHLGFVYQGMGRAEQARELFARSLEQGLEPDNAELVRTALNGQVLR